LGYKTYVGRAVDAPSDSEAVFQATVNAREQAISENFRTWVQIEIESERIRLKKLDTGGVAPYGSLNSPPERPELQAECSRSAGLPSGTTSSISMTRATHCTRKRCRSIPDLSTLKIDATHEDLRHLNRNKD
jgi:hypothetical protein